MKGSGTIIMVRNLHEMQGLSISAIARKEGISRNTVKKYLKEDVNPDRRIGTKRPSKLDPYKDMVKELMEKGIYNSVVVFERIAEKGYMGKISILKEYMQPLRPPMVKEGPAVRRYETKPGSQVQMDWGICKYTDSKGRVRKVACFVMVLGYSRVRYIEFTRRCDVPSLLRCIVNAFEYFGGVPAQLLTDHMKTVVLHVENKKAIWNEAFETFAADLGFVPRLCRVRRPKTKGKVERLVSYVKDNFMPGREFTDILDLNNQAMRWLKNVNGRVHGTTGEIPMHLLIEEKLKPLPADGRHLAYTWENRKVSTDGFVSFDGVKYGVNWRYSGERLKVKATNGHVCILDAEDSVIQEHPVQVNGKKYVYAKNQYDGLTIAEGKPKTPRYGRQTEGNKVYVRDLNEYMQATGGY
jgi:transposase